MGDTILELVEVVDTILVTMEEVDTIQDTVEEEGIIQVMVELWHSQRGERTLVVAGAGPESCLIRASLTWEEAGMLGEESSLLLTLAPTPSPGQRSVLTTL